MNLTDLKTPTKSLKKGDEKKEPLWLSLSDVENLLVLLQQVRVSVGSYPFNSLNGMTETLNKLAQIYEVLKQQEIKGDELK